MNRTISLLSLALVCSLAACGGGSLSSPPPSGLSVSLSSSTASVFQGESPTTVTVNITRNGVAGDIALTVSGAPSGSNLQVQSPGSGESGSVTIDPGTATAGSYPLTVSATAGSAQGSANLGLTIGAVVQISNATSGRFELAMSTSFQPAEWDYQFFQNHPSATTTLGNLLPQHVRLQPLSQAIPERTVSSWDFSILDAITQPVLGVGDHSPQFQIAKAPPFMYAGNDSNGTFLDLSFQQFAGYSQNLVRYYNTGGFQVGATTYASPSSNRITWWGIYNEPNINNNLTPQQYVQLYNTVVPAMQAVDPSLKFVGIELADFSQEPQAWVPPFVNGVTAQVDAVATHFYSTCNQKDSDAQVFSTVPGFATHVRYFYQQMAAKPALASVPVWVTENNVNADFDSGGGISACNGTAFTTDLRGSSAFFSAWRPYVFSQLGKAGTQALYHWDFDADTQFGEVDYNTANPQLSYWVDYWLARMFPSPPGADLLQFSSTDTSDIEILPVQNPDGSVVVMVANYAVNASGDNNGSGSPRTVAIDLSALRTYTNTQLLMIDGSTNAGTGPAAVAETPADRIEITFSGYGVAFLTLSN